MKFLLVALICFAAHALAEEPTLAKTTHIYKTVGPVSIQADVHRPPGTEPRPVLVWLHGGALIVGSRTQVPRTLLDL